MSLFSRLTSSIFTTATVALLLTSVGVRAAHIGFENTALPAELEVVTPSFPHEEEGFLFTPSFGASIISAGGIGGEMIGNEGSDFLWFDQPNTVSMTYSGGEFNLLSLMVGPVQDSILNLPVEISGSIIGNFTGGGFDVINYSNLSTTTLLAPGWMNLSNVVFTTTNYSAVDNVIADIPAPGTLALFGLALIGLGLVRRQAL